MIFDKNDIEIIFSTYVEMNRIKKISFKKANNFLYVCGDEPASRLSPAKSS